MVGGHYEHLMVRAASNGRIDYNQFDPRNPIDKLREQLLLEEYQTSVYTDVWRVLTLVNPTEETSEKFLERIAPWQEAGNRQKARHMKERIREQQYQNEDFRAEVERLMAEDVDKATAEDLAEYHVLKKMGLV